MAKIYCSLRDTYLLGKAAAQVDPGSEKQASDESKQQLKQQLGCCVTTGSVLGPKLKIYMSILDSF